jgi:four helix bundle protein
MAGRNYRDLIAWKRSMNLVLEVYKASKHWPKEETFGLMNQVRRAVVSIPANIAEGQGRDSAKEFLRFLNIANGSLYEVETHLLIASQLGYLAQNDTDAITQQTSEVGRLLNGLMGSLRTRIEN